MTGRLEGKTALITGAGSVGPGWGNGRAEAIIFAREGARLLPVDRDPDALAVTVDTVRSEGGTVAVFEGDVTGSAVVAAAVARCHAEYGRVDILVNKVGGELISKILARGHADGVFRRHPDVIDVHMMISSFCVFRSRTSTRSAPSSAATSPTRPSASGTGP